MAGFPSAAKGNLKGGKAKQPHAGVPLNKETIMKLILDTKGNLARVADMMGSTRTSVRRRIDADIELKEALLEARERQIDELEESVFDRAIDTNDTTLQLFLLKTQGKMRGYEQSESKDVAKDIASAAFDYILNKSKNPAERQ